MPVVLLLVQNQTTGQHPPLVPLKLYFLSLSSSLKASWLDSNIPPEHLQASKNLNNDCNPILQLDHNSIHSQSPTGLPRTQTKSPSLEQYFLNKDLKSKPKNQPSSIEEAALHLLFP